MGIRKCKGIFIFIFFQQCGKLYWLPDTGSPNLTNYITQEGV